MRSQRQRTRLDATRCAIRRPAGAAGSPTGAGASVVSCASQGGHPMSGIIYLIGLAVVVYFVLRLLGLV
jgi:hypothetical protein